MRENTARHMDISPEIEFSTHPVSAIPSNSPSPLVTNAKNGGTLMNENHQRMLIRFACNKQIVIGKSK